MKSVEIFDKMTKPPFPFLLTLQIRVWVQFECWAFIMSFAYPPKKYK